MTARAEAARKNLPLGLSTYMPVGLSQHHDCRGNIEWDDGTRYEEEVIDCLRKWNTLVSHKGREGKP